MVAISTKQHLAILSNRDQESCIAFCRTGAGPDRMAVSAGTLFYKLGAAPCSGAGRGWSDEDLEAALEGRVSELVFDEKGRADIERILGALADTDFARAGLRRILSYPDDIEDWRVGEAIAEAYLADHRSCCFPWPDSRDERKSGSSLPGADLVGIGTDKHGNALAFGEVKTSSEATYPPGAMHGRTGLKRQLEDLRDQERLRDDLMKYLCHRVKDAPWRTCFEAASRRYLQNKSDVHLYGVLIRDVDPRENDLKVRVKTLGDGCPEGMRIELLALYLPNGRISGLGHALALGKKGGDA